MSTRSQIDFRVALLSKAGATGGGAGQVAETLHKLLLNRSIHTDHWVKVSSNLPHTYSLRGTTRIERTIWNFAERFSKRIGYPDLFTPEIFSLMIRRFRNQYNLAHIHDTSSALSPYTIKWLSKLIPIVWTIHDCSPFTAGCLYPMGCTHFLSCCHNCPQLGKWPLDTERDKTEKLHKIKKNIFFDMPVTLIAPSRWMANEIKRSGMFRVDPLVIYNGVDTNIFTPPPDKKTLRVKLGIKPDEFVIVICGGLVSEERKGLALALLALAKWGKKPLVLILGTLKDWDGTSFDSGSIRTTGYIQNRLELASWYSVGDVLLFTSLADNFPNVVLESMAVGVPVVGFSTGGVSEVVEHEVNGWLVKQGDIDGLIAGLDLVRENRSILKQWSILAHRRVTEHFNLDNFISAYLNVYNRVTTSSSLTE